MSDIEWLQNWYASHCDGEWEHGMGVVIDTLDNPGWRVRLDLTGTTHAHVFIEWVRIDRSDNDWMHRAVHSHNFVGCCGSRNLQELFTVLRAFLEAPPPNSDQADDPKSRSGRDGMAWNAWIRDERQNEAPNYTLKNH